MITIPKICKLQQSLTTTNTLNKRHPERNKSIQRNGHQLLILHLCSNGTQLIFQLVITYTFAAKLPWCSMQTCLFVYFGLTFYMGYKHGSLQLHLISEPCSSYFPCQDWDSGVHWDAFSDDLVHWSRGADQSWYTQLERSLSIGDRYIWWDQVYASFV